MTIIITIFAAQEIRLDRFSNTEKKSPAIVGRMLLTVGFHFHSRPAAAERTVSRDPFGRCKQRKAKRKINREGGQGRAGSGILRCMCLVSEKELSLHYSHFI